jgi:hypothetical protein
VKLIVGKEKMDQHPLFTPGEVQIVIGMYMDDTRQVQPAYLILKKDEDFTVAE